MVPARLIDGRDVEIRVEAAYSTPSLRPFALTWCRPCALHRCTVPNHPTLTFAADHQDAAGVWVFRSPEVWPVVPERYAQIQDAHGNPIGLVVVPAGDLPVAVTWAGVTIPLWCQNSGGAVVYRHG